MLAVALCSVVSDVSSAPRLSAAQGNVVAGVYKLLGVAHICRNFLGAQPYDDAKRFGQHIQIEAGIPVKQARLNVRNLDRAVRTEVNQIGRDPGKCRSAIAEVRKALETDALEAKSTRASSR